MRKDVIAKIGCGLVEHRTTDCIFQRWVREGIRALAFERIATFDDLAFDVTGLPRCTTAPPTPSPGRNAPSLRFGCAASFRLRWIVTADCFGFCINVWRIEYANSSADFG
jgi:hypothetical protein